ncbi:MAG TPA: phenylphosphate carboxylase subunit gamma [Thermoleophilia bacterium]|nr:phenylphosphate carboxylase subunit gamma [Thermoleophilia bacterium]
MIEYDTFFMGEPSDVLQDEVTEIVIRDLTPGRHKYRCAYAEVRLSSDADKYPHRLWPRLGRGQWVGEAWSVEVVREVNKIPEAWR